MAMQPGTMCYARLPSGCSRAYAEGKIGSLASEERNLRSFCPEYLLRRLLISSREFVGVFAHGPLNRPPRIFRSPQALACVLLMVQRPATPPRARGCYLLRIKRSIKVNAGVATVSLQRG